MNSIVIVPSPLRHGSPPFPGPEDPTSPDHEVQAASETVTERDSNRKAGGQEVPSSSRLNNRDLPESPPRIVAARCRYRAIVAVAGTGNGAVLGSWHRDSESD